MNFNSIYHLFCQFTPEQKKLKGKYTVFITYIRNLNMGADLDYLN